jgi:biopolymer transport protein ExbD
MADLSIIRARRKKAEEGLTITSIMDMMTIILVFLLKSYSVEDIQVKPSDDLTLPMSTSLKTPERVVNMVVSKSSITVEGNSIMSFVNGEIPEADKKGMLISPLYDALTERAEAAREQAEQYGAEKFEGKILFQCDKDLPYRTVREVMFTAGQAEFGKFKFVVFKME